MEQKRIVIIGGLACGPKAAARARRSDPTASITMLEQDESVSMATCGYPYYVAGVIDDETRLFGRQPDYFKDVLDIDLHLATRAVAIDSPMSRDGLFER